MVRFMIASLVLAAAASGQETKKLPQELVQRIRTLENENSQLRQQIESIFGAREESQLPAKPGKPPARPCDPPAKPSAPRAIEDAEQLNEILRKNSASTEAVLRLPY